MLGVSFFKNPTEKTVHRYISLNDKVGMEYVTDEPRVKKTPVIKAASKKRPAVTTAAEPVVKKKRTTKSKSGASKDKLEILPITQAAVPLQIIDPTPAAPAEQTPIEKVVENIAEPVSEPEVADVANAGMSIADDVDIIIAQVLAETAQIGLVEEQQDVGGLDVAGIAVSESGVGEQAAPKADELEQWLNLSYEEFHACLDADRPIETASDTDEDMETVEKMDTEAVEKSVDEAMSLEDIFMTIPVECPLLFSNVEITKIILGKSISIPGVDEWDWYKADLPKIPTVDKGKAPLMERDPIKGNPVKEQFSLILVDIEVLVQLREQIIDDVDRFFNSFSLKKLANLKIDESYFDKEALILSWAETESTRVALNRRMYILTKYRELLIKKFLEARKINFVPADIRNELLEFRVHTHGQLASLGTHLAELIAFITKGSDDKKGEDSSSRCPQPPPDNQSRPSGGCGGSGNRADEQSRPVGSGTRESGSRGGSQRRGDSSGSSKRIRSSGESPVRGIRYGPYPPGAPPKKNAKYWMTGENDF
ncbi:hypothetical protein F511_14772 [Dorcoceras hygrometricum]|uniref:Uncharacterized protein n=1 Tax=Dorcoceras hygrometricum TaxID=472368 RepID=A0A2Z7DEW6_9LAMI|nr:hypothetical protein F511_14772 [Dorcoceras hygrometricum]